MTDAVKQKTVNMEDLQAHSKVLYNKGIGNKGTCTTASATAAKEVTFGTTFALTDGATALVRFTYGINAENATLTVTYTDAAGTQQTTAAKPIYYRGAALPAGLVQAGDTLMLKYENSSSNRWIVVGTLDSGGAAYESKPAASGGTDISLVTTGEKYIWNSKQDAVVFNTAYDASSNKAATMSDIPSSLPANGGNAATVNNHTVGTDVPSNAVFTDNNTTYKLNLNGTDTGGGTTSLGTVYGATTAGTSGQYLKSSGSGAPTWDDMPTSLPASDVSAWAKAANKPSYAYSEIGYSVNATSSAGGTLSLDGTTPLHVVTLTGNVSALTLSANPSAGHSCHVILTAAAEQTVAIAHDATSRVCPGAEDVSLTIQAGGYVEIDFLNANSKIYVRGV